MIVDDHLQMLNGDTLAHHLIRRKNTEIFKILMDNDAPTDIQNVSD